MISFALDEEQELVQRTARKFAAEVVRPRARAWERAGAVPDEALAQGAELALGLLDVPEAAGGAGQGPMTTAIVDEELAFGDPGAAVALGAPHLAAAAVVELADAVQAERLLARFADPTARGAVAWSEPAAGIPEAGFATTATPVAGGFRLDGRKVFVVNGGRAALTIVFAQLAGAQGAGWDGIGAFAVEGAPAGMTSGERYRTLGLEAVHAAPVAFEDVFVPDENRLAGGGDRARLLRFFARAALRVAARQVGLARAAYEYALGYTQDRSAFGKPVAHFQSVAFTLADMHMDAESARWMLWRAAAAREAGLDDEEVARLVAEAAAHANEAAFRVADNAVQLLGGAGFIQDYPVEKWLRDTKTLALLAPSDQLQQLRAAAPLVGGALEVPLPGPALQPLFT